MCNECGINPKHGRSGLCKPCKNAYNKKHYAANKQYYIDKANKARKKVYEELSALKEKTPCADCKLNYPSYVMDFDHLGNKEFDVARGHGVSKKKLMEEIAKCEIVCSNCHRVRTHNRHHATQGA